MKDKTTPPDAPQLPEGFTHQEILEWMIRHDWNRSESEAKCAMDDAASLHPIETVKDTPASVEDMARQEGLETRMDQPWCLRDILAKLAEAADILINHKDHTADGWEAIEGCRLRALEILSKPTVGAGCIRPPVPAQGGETPRTRPEVWNPLSHGIHGVPLMVPAADYNTLERELAEFMEASPTKSDWCPCCKQGWTCSKDDQQNRVALHAAQQDSKRLVSLVDHMRKLADDPYYVTAVGSAEIAQLLDCCKWCDGEGVVSSTHPDVAGTPCDHCDGTGKEIGS